MKLTARALQDAADGKKKAAFTVAREICAFCQKTVYPMVPAPALLLLLLPLPPPPPLRVTRCRCRSDCQQTTSACSTRQTLAAANASHAAAMLTRDRRRA